MSSLRRIAEIPAGSWTKWLVVGFWLVVLVLAFPLSTKLTGAEKNDASAWLPGNAESTQVLNVQSRFQSPNVYPGVVVYVRDSGITAADRAKATVDARRFAGVPGALPGQIVGPVESRPADGLSVDFVVEADRALLNDIVQRVRDGRLRTNIGTVADLDDAVTALNPTDRIKGKTIIQVRR